MSDERAAEIILERIKKEESLEIDTMSVSEINALKKACVSLMRRVSPLTNYDRLISKTPEEMAEWINNNSCLCAPGKEPCEDGECEECWLDWLKQEAEK